MAKNFNTKPLDRIFDDFLSGPQIFKNRDVMRATFVPEDLPHREEQISRIGKILATILKGGVPSNIFLYGKTGTGKTAVALYVLKRIVAKCEEISITLPLKEIINCKDIDTDYRVFARLSGAVGEEVPFTGLPTDEVFSRFKLKLDSEQQTFIIVLDEIDQLVKKTSKKGSPNKVLYELTRINSELDKARVCIIGISNDLKFKEYLDPRVLSSLSEEEMVFPPYKATELLDILKQRSEMGFYPDVITEGTIEITAALAAREHGDARRAIDLLRVAGELAERESDENVTESHVRRAQTLIERDTISDALKTLPIQSKLVLYSIYLLERNDILEIYTGDVYTTYSQLCDGTRVDKLTQRRVSDLINELDMLGIVNAQVISKGRYGRSKKIRLSIPKSIITSILEEDYVIKKIKDFPIEMKKEED
ncbi:MAG: ORC1-type DNA replication protein [Candidatus Helarchaeota archaeon]|nr:ORC1-type DNA replication protein [Candidatus Helarchaeota archaeon]